jgi:hypothetical protein
MQWLFAIVSKYNALCFQPKLRTVNARLPRAVAELAGYRTLTDGPEAMVES